MACDCGTCYVGESSRNLKIRIRGHAQKSSKSNISLHIAESVERQRLANLPQDHCINYLSTNVISHEKNNRKRKFIESVCIKSKSAKLCNVGGSTAVSEIWDLSLAMVARLLKNLD